MSWGIEPAVPDNPAKTTMSAAPTKRVARPSMRVDTKPVISIISEVTAK